MKEVNTKDSEAYIDKYHYFISGLQIGNEIFTVKSVIGIDRKEKTCYHDHKLINIDKKILIEAAGKTGAYVYSMISMESRMKNHAVLS